MLRARHTVLHQRKEGICNFVRRMRKDEEMAGIVQLCNKALANMSMELAVKSRLVEMIDDVDELHSVLAAYGDQSD